MQTRRKGRSPTACPVRAKIAAARLATPHAEEAYEAARRDEEADDDEEPATELQPDPGHVARATDRQKAEDEKEKPEQPDQKQQNARNVYNPSARLIV